MYVQLIQLYVGQPTKQQRMSIFKDDNNFIF